MRARRKYLRRIDGLYFLVTIGDRRATDLLAAMRAAPQDASVHPIRPSEGSETSSDTVLDPLVAAAVRGDGAAWARLYRTHYPSVLRHLMGLVGARSLAEDLAQETFARAMVAVASFSGRSTFTTWVHGIALNVARGHWRTAAADDRRQAQLELIEATRQLRECDLDRAHQKRQRAKVLYAVLAELGEGLREAFILRYIEGLTAADVGARLSVAPNAVRVRAHRARQHVEARLRDLGWTSPIGGASS